MKESEKRTIASMMRDCRKYGEINIPTWNWHLGELIRSAYPLEFGLDNNIKMGSAMFKRDMKRLFLLKGKSDV